MLEEILRDLYYAKMAEDKRIVERDYHILQSCGMDKATADALLEEMKGEFDGGSR